ncbi:MAG TPA: class I SAM-dependent methyltransferase [Candidatus Saccharimonadales bacterium]|nr:class I SAM-dependent methyltransferase [Candidatus Saccharimonadales bacterium]
MNDSNQQTIDAYQSHVQEYIDGTPQQVDGVVKEWMDSALAGLPADADILEFGSAFGRDTEYIQGKGFKVNSTDATPAFVELLQKKGLNARVLNAITDDLGGPYDLVIANAVLLHFTREETEKVLAKVLAALKDGGRFAFTLKQGEGETWEDSKLGAPRYFCFWQEQQIEELLKKVGYSQVEVSGDKATRNNTTWVQVIAHK